MKLALVTEIAAPYRIPLLNALAASPEVELRVLLLAEQDPRRDYPFYRGEFRFDWRVLRGRGIRRGLRWVVFSRGVRRALEQFGPDAVIVGGWNQPAFWRSIAWARRTGVPLVLWVESTPRDERRGLAPFEAAKRFAVGSAAGFLVPGRAAAEYLRSLGAEPALIAVAPNAVDLGLFGEQVAAARARREELRAELALEGCVYLCVSRLSREKGVDLLARAFHGVEGTLILAGDGPERAVVEAAAPAGTRLLGHVAREDLPRLYAAADVFVMPSRSETWGMAMNEAAAAGLPLVATEAPGAAHELIDEGVNGFRVPSDDEAALREALRRAGTPAWREGARARTLELAAGYTPEGWADAVATLGRKLAPARLTGR